MGRAQLQCATDTEYSMEIYIYICIDIDFNTCENDQFALLVRCSRFNPIWNICKIYSHFYGCYFLCSFILLYSFFIRPPPPPADLFLRFRFTTHTHTRSHNKLFIAHTCYEKKEWKRMAILITKYLDINRINILPLCAVPCGLRRRWHSQAFAVSIQLVCR